MQALVRLHRQKVEKLTPIIGADAARLAVTANEWAMVMLVVLMFFALPTSIWASNGGPVVPTGIFWLAGLTAGVTSIWLSPKGDRHASESVSARLGYRVTLRGRGTSARRWRRRIESATSAARHRH